MLFCCLKNPLAFPGALKISQSSSPAVAKTPCASASPTPVHSFVILELLRLDSREQQAQVPTLLSRPSGLGKGNLGPLGGPLYPLKKPTKKPKEIGRSAVSNEAEDQC